MIPGGRDHLRGSDRKRYQKHQTIPEEDRLAFVRRMVDGMPPRKRAAVLLRLCGMSTREVAEVLVITQPAVIKLSSKELRIINPKKVITQESIYEEGNDFEAYIHDQTHGGNPWR